MATATPAHATSSFPGSSSETTQATTGPLLLTEWEDVLLWYLLWLYQTLGGDPNWIHGKSPLQAMDAVTTLYAKQPLPELTETERLEFAAGLESLWRHLQEAPAAYQIPEVAEFADIVMQIHGQVAGAPGAPG